MNPGSSILIYLVYFSLYLFKLGMAPQIEDLYGKVNFTGIITVFIRITALCT